MLPKTFEQPVGVLGLSEFGPGVRGHGTSLPHDPTKPPDLFFNPDCAPGGVFSSGFNLDVVNVGAGPTQDVSLKNSPQLRLVPFRGILGDVLNVFPLNGMVGDFFFALTVPLEGQMVPPTAALFICLSIDPPTGLPVWSKVVTAPGSSSSTPGLGGTPII
jgi:hypothetical protein